MFNSTTPQTLFIDRLDTLRSQLPGIRDGQETSVHDSRVTTRRLRELLQLAAGISPRPVEELHARLSSMGKALGRVRDADVRIGLISGLEERIPQAAPWLVTLRHTQEREREKLVRRLIKRLEKLDVRDLIEHAATRHSPVDRVMATMSHTGRWRRELRRIIAARAQATAESIEHAAGAYFPNRIHGVRIALKKLRYAIEIARATGTPDLDSPLRDLKKAQDALGDLHDRQTFLDEIPASMPAATETGSETLVTVVEQVVEAEAHKLHERYLARRKNLVEIASQMQAIRIGRSWVVPSLATATAGVIALSSGAYVMRRHLGRTRLTPAIAPSPFERRALIGT